MTAAVIETQAPGKLFVAGEYAVVTPGEPSVIVAVDRYVTVRLRETTGAGTIHSPDFGRVALTWTRGADGLSIDRERHPYDYVLSAIRVAEGLRRDLDLAPRIFDLHIDSSLDDASGRKFGLGSSAAVTVAALRAMDELYGFGLDRIDLFRLALLATIEVAPTASGGDVAASTFGGWIGYSAPDRALLRERAASGSVASLLHSDAWEGLSVRRLPPPAGLRFLVGWTGAPASTTGLVAALTRRVEAGAADGAAFLLDSRACVDGLWDALETGDDAGVLAAVHRNRRLLQRLGAQTGVAIETPELARLCDAAEAIGAAAKSSGAGGGDCGVVLAPADSDVTRMLRDWEDHDIRHLAISVHPPEGSIHVG